ncbi:MAG: hypothetical protein DRJ05_14110, partial [Bacteroidetes bacterium]
MRKITIILTILFAYTLSNLNAQVAGTNDGSMPDNSAMLDIKSNDKGILVPRMTTAERDAIISPANSLLVFVTDDNQFYYNVGTSGSPNWAAMGGSGTDSDWTVSGNNMFSAVSGNVGIGDNYPSSKFDIFNGNMEISSEGNDAYIKIVSDEESDASESYIWTEDAKGFAIGSTPGTPLVLVNAWTGNMGIGTDTPNEKLEVNGSIRMTDGNQAAGKVMISDANGTASWQDLSMTSDDDWTISGNNMYSTVSGNVGIGTANPNQKLQIRNGNLTLMSQYEDAYIKLSSDEEEDITPAYIWSENAKGFSVGSTPGTPQLLVNAASGNVGIGTVNPDSKLHVLGDITASGKILASWGSGNNASYRFGSGNENTGFSSPTSNTLAIVSNGLERMRITSSGNVGIGTSSPSAKLEVNGQVKITGGAPGPGKVLTSADDQGYAFWFDLPVGVSSISDLSDAHYDGKSLFLGYDAGINDNGNNFNTGLGKEALKANTSGQDNTAMGYQSIYSNVNGNRNSGFGLNALRQNVSGSNNVAMGYEASYKNTTGYSNVAIGTHSLYWAENTHNIVAIGDSALNRNGLGGTLSSHGSENTAVGSKALYGNTLGNQNTAIGTESLKINSEGKGNTAIGAHTLDSNTSGDNNTAGGAFALTGNTTGDNNTAFGHKSAYNITDGGYNASYGSNSLYSEITGTHNSAFGYGSLFFHESGDENTAIGYKAMYSNDNGTENTAIGSQAGYNNSGSGNVFIGNKAGYNSLLSNKLFIDNTNTDTPLIYGDFYWNKVGINGLLGVNMQAPLYHLHVNGNSKINEYLIVGEDVEVGTDVTVGDDVTAGGDVITAGDFKYSTGKVCLMNIPAASFGLSTNQDADKMSFNQSKGSWEIVNEDGNGSYSIQAGVYLPQGANVTKFSIWTVMSGESITVTLRRRPMGAG